MLKIALLQILPGKSREDNRKKGWEFSKRAKEAGADVALFPEMWSNGYRIYGRPVPEWTAEAIPFPDAKPGDYAASFSARTGASQKARAS